jgi:hypothetical protein
VKDRVAPEPLSARREPAWESQERLAGDCCVRCRPRAFASVGAVTLMQMAEPAFPRIRMRRQDGLRVVMAQERRRATRPPRIRNGSRGSRG